MFGVIFKSDSKQKAENFANKIRENIENLYIEHSKNSVSPYITASLGVICKNAREIDDAYEIYKQADSLLYKSKENGRNRVSIN
ncbi:MAG: diguanylate cyclase [Campylobacterales bacterium]|nr:diguanylate cyclase [Campylobacterales bacterium]